MVQTYEEKQAAKVARFVGELTGESEFFALVGLGFPGSFYKVYVRQKAGAGKWWRFKSEAGPYEGDPIKSQGELAITGRATAVWAPFPRLVDFTHHPDRKAIAMLFARAKELAVVGAA